MLKKIKKTEGVYEDRYCICTYTHEFALNLSWVSIMALQRIRKKMKRKHTLFVH
jgi:hypothetical protein